MNSVESTKRACEIAAASEMMLASQNATNTFAVATAVICKRLSECGTVDELAEAIAKLREAIKP